jgi:multiple sugar transport system substrate-binding protein
MNDKRNDNLLDRSRDGRISRRTFIKRALALRLSAASVTGLLEACTLAPAAPTAAPMAPPAPELLEALNVLLFSHDAEIQQKKGPAFEEKRGTRLKFETVVAADHRDKIISSHRAEASAWDTIPQWSTVAMEMAERGWLVDLTDSVETTLMRNVDDLVSGAALFQAATYKGRIYAIPDKVGGPILQWNKEILKKRGLDPERPAEWHKIPYSIDEFVEWAKECTFEEGGVQYWGFASEWGKKVVSTFHMIIQMYGGNTFDMTKNEPFGEPTMNSEEGVVALQWMVDLLHKHQCIDPASITYDWVFDFTPGYLGGRTAFVSTWPFVTHVAQDREKSVIVDKNGFAPNFAAETSATIEGTEFQAISSFAPHGLDAAWLWLEHMSSYEMMRLQGLESGWAPIYKSLLNDPEITQAMFEGPVIAQSLDYPHQRYFTPDAAQWDEILRGEIHAALREEKTPSEALDAAVEGIKAMRASA